MPRSPTAKFPGRNTWINEVLSTRNNVITWISTTTVSVGILTCEPQTLDEGLEAFLPAFTASACIKDHAYCYSALETSRWKYKIIKDSILLHWPEFEKPSCKCFADPDAKVGGADLECTRILKELHEVVIFIVWNLSTTKALKFAEECKFAEESQICRAKFAEKNRIISATSDRTPARGES